jgi:hypothetical protein
MGGLGAARLNRSAHASPTDGAVKRVSSIKGIWSASIVCRNKTYDAANRVSRPDNLEP